MNCLQVPTTTMKLLLLFSLLLSQSTAVKGWNSRAFPLRQHVSSTTKSLSSSFSSVSHSRVPHFTSFLNARNGNSENDSSDRTEVVYNDDAFGLIFLSSFFVAKDYTFAACFGALSFLAVILVQFGGFRFNPLLPGLVAISSFIVTSIVGNVVTDAVPEDAAIPVELGATAVSLIWGLIQATRENGN